MKLKFEKKINKRLVGLVIGSAIVGAGGLSMTPKGKGFWKKLGEKMGGFFGFFKSGLDQMKKDITKKKL